MCWNPYLLCLMSQLCFRKHFKKKFFLLVALHPFTYDVWHMDVYIFKIVVKLPTPKKIY